MARLVKLKGWHLKRINGSHHIYAKEGRIERISIPIHGNKPLKTGLQNYLMKMGEISPSEL